MTSPGSNLDLDALGIDALITLLRRLVDMPGLMAEFGMVPVEETAWVALTLPTDDSGSFLISPSQDGKMLNVTFDSLPKPER